MVLKRLIDVRWSGHTDVMNALDGATTKSNPALENFEYHLGSSRVLIVNVMQNIRGMSAMLVVVLIITG